MEKKKFQELIKINWATLDEIKYDIFKDLKNQRKQKLNSRRKK